MKKTKEEIEKLIEESNIKVNKNTGGICSLKYFISHECKNCKRNIVCDLICEYLNNFIDRNELKKGYKKARC